MDHHRVFWESLTDFGTLADKHITMLADSTLWSLFACQRADLRDSAVIHNKTRGMCFKIIPRSQTQFLSFVIHWFFDPLFQSHVPFPSFSPLFLFFLLPPPLFLASGVPVLLIRLYQCSNLATTAWVSVARRAAPLSCPAVAEINPQIEQSPRWPLQTPKSRSVHPTSRDSLCFKLFS